MSFSSSLKKIFGFGPVEMVDDEQLLSDDVRPEVDSPAHHDAKAKAEPVDSPQINQKAVADIFDSVIEIFNQSLPQFLKESVNPDAQKEYLYKSLEQSLKDYLSQLNEDARVFAENAVANTTRETAAELARLRQEKQNIEQQRASIKEQQLSADRRRRALQDRVGDLEALVTQLEAEREQFDLENKSLLNKIKLAEVQPGIIEELQAENARLKEQLSAGGGDVTLPDMQEEIASREKQIAELKATIEAHEQGVKTSTEMLNSLQHEMVKERRASEETLAAVKSDLQQANNLIEELRGEIREKDTQLDEAAELLKGMERIDEQMKQVEEAISKRDEKIKVLQGKNKEYRARIEKLEKKVGKGAVPELPFGTDHAVEGSEEYTSSMIATSPIRPEDLVDDDFHDSNWLISTPPKGTVIRSELTEEEFGYQAPAKKPKTKENDAQLSLF